MKKLIKNKWPLLLMIVVLIISAFIAVGYKLVIRHKEYNYYLDVQHKFAENSELYKEYYDLYGPLKPNISETANDMFLELFWDTPLNIINFELWPLIISFFAIYEVSKYLKKDVLNHFLTRQNYKQFIRKILTTSWLWSLVIPIFWILLYGLCIVFTDKIGPASDSSLLGDKGIMMIILFSLYMMMQCFMCANISLTSFYKTRNVVLSCFITYLIYFALEFYTGIILEDGINAMLSLNPNNTFHIFSDHLTLSVNNYLFPYSYFGLVIRSIVLVVLFLYSYLIVKYAYRNKERLLTIDEN